MVYSLYEQKTFMAQTLEEEQKEDPKYFLTEIFMEELAMGPNELPKAKRLIQTLEAAVKRHVSFETYTDLLINLPEYWQNLGNTNWQQISYRERLKTIFPLIQEVIQQDQLDRNFDIIYTEDAMAFLEGFFRALRKNQF